MANNWKELLTRALQGEEDAVAAVAQRLEAGPSEADTRDREELVDAAARFRENFPDLHKDPAELQRAVELDAMLHKRYPHLDYEARLNMVGNAVRAGQSAGQTSLEAGYSDTIRKMRESRKPQEIPQRGAPKPDDDDQDAIVRRQSRGFFGNQ